MEEEKKYRCSENVSAADANKGCNSEFAHCQALLAPNPSIYFYPWCFPSIYCQRQTHGIAHQYIATYGATRHLNIAKEVSGIFREYKTEEEEVVVLCQQYNIAIFYESPNVVLYEPSASEGLVL